MSKNSWNLFTAPHRISTNISMAQEIQLTEITQSKAK
jgi:hypothetical protein